MTNLTMAYHKASMKLQVTSKEMLPKAKLGIRSSSHLRENFDHYEN